MSLPFPLLSTRMTIDNQRLITLDACPDFIPQSFTAHVGELACHPYGCRVLQKTFECLQSSQTRQLLEEMHQEILKFTNDQFGSEYLVPSLLRDW
jgi:hypothetical protein